MKVEVGRTDRLLRLLATTSVGNKRKGSVSLSPGNGFSLTVSLCICYS